MKYTIPFRYGMTAVCAMLLAGGCHKKEKDETASAPEVDVAVAYEDSVVLHKSFPGTIVANDNAEVVARVSGQVLETPFKEGQYVRKGQTLFIIDPAPYRDAAARAEAELATAESSYSYASSHYEAMKEALKEDAVSRMEVLQAESAMNQAAAAIKSAKASLSTARENLGFCTVRAPISGNVSEIMQTKGNFVNGGASPVVLTKIFDNNNLSAQFEVSAPLYQTMVAANGGAESAFFSKVPLEFRVPLNNTYHTDLAYQAPSVDQSTGTVMLKGSVTNIDDELKDGMYVTVSLPYGVSPHAVIVKDASIGNDQLGKYIYVVNDSNRVVYTPVETGELLNDSLRIITRGVSAGQKYVSKALLTVRNGEPVRPVVNDNR